MSEMPQNDAQAVVQPSTPSLAMFATLAGIATLSGLLVVLVFQFTLPLINENKRIAIEKALFQVVPGAVSRQDFSISSEGAVAIGEQESADNYRLYVGYDAEGKLQGIAMEAAAQGYQDVIRILYGYNPACHCITGIKVLKMAETPGLGDKIVTDKNFVANFNALDASLNADGDALANEIVTVKHGTKTSPWQIDAISGATISSNAIGKMLNQSMQLMAPLIHKFLSTLEVKS